MGSGEVAYAFQGDQLLNYVWYLEELIKMQYHFLIYAGEFDAQDGPATIEPWLREQLKFEGSD